MEVKTYVIFKLKLKFNIKRFKFKDVEVIFLYYKYAVRKWQPEFTIKFIIHI